MTLETYPLQQNTIDLSQERFPAIARIWQGNSLEFPAGKTHFGYIYQGSCLLFRQATGESYNLHSGMYFCLPGSWKLEGLSSGIAIANLNLSGNV